MPTPSTEFSPLGGPWHLRSFSGPRVPAGGRLGETPLSVPWAVEGMREGWSDTHLEEGDLEAFALRGAAHDPELRWSSREIRQAHEPPTTFVPQVQDDSSPGSGEPDGLVASKARHGDHRPVGATLARDHGRNVGDTVRVLNAGLDPGVLVDAQHTACLS